MPVGYVVKCHPDEDFYVVWSDIVEAPTFFGTREEIERYLHRRQGRGGDRPVQQRLADADLRGTSAMWPSTEDPYLGWATGSLIYEQRGVLPRAKLRALCEALQEGNEEAAWDLLEPFEADCPVRRG